MPATGLSVDPLASEYPGWSPYNYTMNNPIKYIDPNGENVEVKEDEETITYTATYYLIKFSIDETAAFNISLSKWKSALEKYSGTDASSGKKIVVNFTVENAKDELDSMTRNPSGNVVKRSRTGNKSWASPTLQKIVHSFTIGEQPKDFATGIHEIGHTLGLRDRYDTRDKDSHALPLMPNDIMGGSSNTDVIPAAGRILDYSRNLINKNGGSVLINPTNRESKNRKK